MRKNKKRSILGWILKSFIKLCLVLVFFSMFQVLAFKYVNPPGTVNMVWERILSKINKTKYISSKYYWQDLEKISIHLKKAVLASEDQRFLTHNGFDCEDRF
jgi:monofunctional biosynthetic peptidoglycan transglycosylase